MGLYLPEKLSSKYVPFLTQIRKDYAILVICTKNETICETGSINMLILADKACQFTNVLNITSLRDHNDIIENLSPDLKSGHQN